MKKRIVSIVLVAVIAVTFMPSLSFAAMKTGKMSDINMKKATVDQSFGVSEKSTETLPASVDLRERGTVTPVKQQSPFGTCWGFAVIAASETSILNKLGKTYEETDLDLSEHHLAWFAYTPINDKSNSQNGEGFNWIGGQPKSEDVFNQGGWMIYGSNLFSAGMGPVTESISPYRNKEGKIHYSLDEDDNLVKNYYSSQGDWSIPESDRFRAKYELSESTIIDSPVEWEYKNGEKVKTGFKPEIIEAVKERIYKGHAVTVAYCADSSPLSENGNQDYLDWNTWSQYTDKIEYANHAVCIVGYDDNYSRKNFNAEVGGCPPGDGAFLIKNSWGSEENEFPNGSIKGEGWGIVDKDTGLHTGYFWLSYYDQTIEVFEDFDFDVDNDGRDYYICDKYDYMPTYDATTITVPKKSRMANVFTAEYHQKLRDISFITSSPETLVKCSVYLINKNSTNPEDGTLATTFTGGPYKLGGYHRETISTPVDLKKGQKYAIVAEYVNAEGNSEIMLPLGESYEAARYYEMDCYANGVINKGESFINYGGEWYDWSDVNGAFVEKSDWETGESSVTDNFSLTAYSNPVTTLAKTKGLKLSKAKAKKKASIKATWNKNADATGYQIAYKYKNSKKWTNKKTTKSSYVISKLNKGKNVSVKVRAYLKLGSTYYYGKWSTIQNIVAK